jgi:DNA-binding NarL/FixJ family response regulator
MQLWNYITHKGGLELTPNERKREGSRQRPRNNSNPTPVQSNVLALLARGLSRPQIAEEMGRGKHTVQ